VVGRGVRAELGDGGGWRGGILFGVLEFGVFGVVFLDSKGDRGLVRRGWVGEVFFIP
jgi:hypothetical protein